VITATKRMMTGVIRQMPGKAYSVKVDARNAGVVKWDGDEDNVHSPFRDDGPSQGSGGGESHRGRGASSADERGRSSAREEALAAVQQEIEMEELEAEEKAMAEADADE
jgi:hypothetical protein